VDKAAIDIGNLSGKFEQHIIESERVWHSIRQAKIS
jgi:hypothetical protein